MRKSLKIFAISLCALCAGFLHQTNIFASPNYPKPSTSFYVNDLANAIDTETENYIIDSNVALKAKTGGQIVVMTVESLEGEDIETYANKIFNQYGIGDKDKDNGTLILLSTGDRKSRIELGDRTAEFITSGASGRIQDQYMIPYFKNDNWNEGLRKGFDGVLAYYQNHYELEISSDATIPQDTATNAEDSADNLVTVSFFIGVVIGIFSRANKLSRRICAISGFILSVVPLFLSNFFSSEFLFITCTFGIGLIFGAILRFTGHGGGYHHYYHGGGSSSGGGYTGGGGHSSGSGSSRSF